MHLQILVENHHGNGYRATCLSLPGMVAEAPTRDEAISVLEDSVRKRLSQAELRDIDVSIPNEPHPLLAVAGIMKDHPDLDAWIENMAEYRRQVDADPARP